MEHLTETDQDVIMSSSKYLVKLKQIGLVKLKFNHAIENFSQDNLSTETLNNYKFHSKKSTVF